MARTNTVRIGYARVSGRSRDHQLQLDALDDADCREVVIETASTRGDRPKLRKTLGMLKSGDTLVVYKPDRVPRCMKELLVLLEDELHARDVNLHILTGLHKPNGQTMADDAPWPAEHLHTSTGQPGQPLRPRRAGDAR